MIYVFNNGLTIAAPRCKTDDYFFVLGGLRPFYVCFTIQKTRETHLYRFLTKVGEVYSFLSVFWRSEKPPQKSGVKT